MGKSFVKFLRLVVRNDAMRDDPPQIYGWRVFALVCAFVSTLQVGCFVASLVASPCADKFGRRWSLIVSASITCVGVALQAIPTRSLPFMYTGRLVAGFGVGAASMLTPLYVSECAPRAIRGALTGFYQLFIVNGGMLSFWVNFASGYHWQDRYAYIIPLSLQAVPAILMVTGMLWCPESPRWTARQNDWERTSDILCTITSLPPDHDYVENELHEMAEQLEIERRLVGDATAWTLMKEMWFIPGNRKRALISIGLMICQQMTGTNAINYYAPQIFQAMGIGGTDNPLFATGVYGIVKVVACLAFLIFAADSLGRRKSLLWTSIAQAICMFIIGVYVYKNPPTEDAPIPPFGYVALVCIFLFAAFFQFGWGPCCWIYVSEIPSARLRAMNVAQAAATQWLFNFVVARSKFTHTSSLETLALRICQAVPTMMRNMGYAGYGTYFLFGSFCAAMFFFAFFLVPETKGMSLEKMDELFGITDMLRVLNDMERRQPYDHRETRELDDADVEKKWERFSG
ncbi:general substrate transporter [Pseudomassariella vexata]|uniref:General substrate transporter n=1 Tax=Pseudomassariella vexata TaxID=1141098 RepID=A0A1Y2EIW7_9PEZI|nr:general substrate transporter [Pseudomassariella vexata]ORY71176.1 general substrate transporter [Pseudomassariella vexata]